MDFYKAFVKIAVFLSVVLGLLLLLFAIGILFFPEILLQVVKYAIGGVMLLAGLWLIVRLICALLKP